MATLAQLQLEHPFILTRLKMADAAASQIAADDVGGLSFPIVGSPERQLPSIISGDLSKCSGGSVGNYWSAALSAWTLQGLCVEAVTCKDGNSNGFYVINAPGQFSVEIQKGIIGFSVWVAGEKKTLYARGDSYEKLLTSLPGSSALWPLNELQPTVVVNQLINPNGEYASAGITGWKAGFKTKLLERSTERFRTGSASFKITPEIGEHQIFFQSTVTKYQLNKKYCSRVSVWFPKAGVYNIEIRNPESHWSAGNDQGGNITVSGPEWRDITFTNKTYTAEDTSNQYTVVVTLTGGGSFVEGEVFFIDQVLLVEGSVLPSYVDGDTYGNIWSGKAGESTTLKAPVAKDTYGANNGEYTGGVVLGESGGLSGDTSASVKLDGVSGYIRIPNSASLQPAGAITLAAWIKYAGTASIEPIIRKVESFDFLLRNGTPCINFNHGGTSSEVNAGVKLTAGVWSHVAVTYDGTTIRMYINGVQVKAEAPFSGPFSTSTEPIAIGASLFPGGPAVNQFGSGNVQYTSIGTQAISAQQVLELYAGTLLKGFPQHVVCNYDPVAGEMSIWLDGSMISSMHVTGSIGNSLLENVSVLKPTGSSSTFAMGQDIAVYGEPLSSTHVKRHFEAFRQILSDPGHVRQFSQIGVTT